MSRSGTSVVTEVFHRAGFHVGGAGELLAADAGNPRGYFENLRIHDENERILAESGGSWLEPPPPERLLANGKQTSGRLREILEQVREEASGAPIAVKDPRVGVLLPVWKPAFGGVLLPVVVVRHPVEIAMSLAKRDLTPIPVVIAAWEVHMTGLLGAFTGEPVTVVHYAQLLEQPELAVNLVAEVSEHLDPALRAAIDPTRAAEARDPELWRHRSHPEELGTRLTSFQAELWQFLSELPPGRTHLDPPDRLLSPSQAALEAIAGESGRIATIERLRRELAQALANHQASQLELAAFKVEVERLNAALEAISHSNSWRMTRPLRELGARFKHPRHGA